MCFCFCCCCCLLHSISKSAMKNIWVHSPTETQQEMAGGGGGWGHMSIEYQAVGRNLYYSDVTLSAILKKRQVFLCSSRSCPSDQPWNYLQTREKENPIISENQQICIKHKPNARPCYAWGYIKIHKNVFCFSGIDHCKGNCGEQDSGSG